MKNTMRKAFLLLALVLIVAGGAFAQRVGDTVQVNGQTYTILTVSGDTIVLQRGGTPAASVPSGTTGLSSPLDGVWGAYSNQRTRFVNRARFNISGSSGVLTDISEVEATNNIFRDALVKGFVRVGDPILRNIQGTGATTWSCEVLHIEATGNTATSVQWRAGTITGTSNNSRFTIAVNGFGDVGTFSRR
jgi:hypothetical protein